jgi:hypothetical protein
LTKIANGFTERGFKGVSKQNLRYRLQRMKKTGTYLMVSEVNKPALHVRVTDGPPTNISPLTIEEHRTTVTEPTNQTEPTVEPTV